MSTSRKIPATLVAGHVDQIHNHVSEALATAFDREGGGDGITDMLLDAHLAVWRLRWELGWVAGSGSEATPAEEGGAS